jgi:hypothetical protein
MGAPGDDDNGSQTGAAYTFVRSGTLWSEQAKLLASDGATFDFLGQSVAVSGDTAVAGAPDDDDNGNDAGSAYVFDATPQGNGERLRRPLRCLFDRPRHLHADAGCRLPSGRGPVRRRRDVRHDRQLPG